MSAAWLMHVSPCYSSCRLSWPLEITRGSGAEGTRANRTITVGGGVGIVGSSG